MAGRGDIKAGRAAVEVGLNRASLEKGLKAAEARLRAFGASIASIGLKVAAAGTAMLAPFLGSAKIFAENGSALADMSARIGVAVDQLQELGFAAEQTGSSLQGVEAGLKGLAKTVADARRGSKEAAASLAELGISIEDLQGLSPDQQFRRIAKALAEVEDATTRSALAQKVLGKSGRELLPMIADIQALGDQWRKMGTALSAADVDAADKLGDSFDVLKKSIVGVANQVGAALAPTLTDLLDRTSDVVQAVARWVKDNRALVLTTGKIAAGVAAAGVAMIALGGAIIAASLAVKGLALAVGLVAGTLAAVKAIALAIISPIGLIALAVTGAAAALIYFSDVGDEALSFLKGKFGDLATTATDTWSGIVDAIAAGDLAAAGKIAIAGLKLAWFDGTEEIRSVWRELTYGMQTAWVRMSSFVSHIWTSLSAGIRSTFESVTSWVAKRINEVWGAFDSSFDAAAANAIVDQNSASAIADIEKQRERDLANLAAEEAEALKGIIVSAAEREKAARDGLQAAKDELAALREKAAQARQETEERQRNRPELELPDLGEAVKSAFSSTGTFNLSAVFGLAGGPMDALVKNSSEQVRILRRIEEKDGDTFI